jgi:SET and MYND domain-containing protein
MTDALMAAATPGTAMDEIRLACAMLWRHEAEQKAAATDTAGTVKFEDVENLESHHEEILGANAADRGRAAATRATARAVLARLGHSSSNSSSTGTTGKDEEEDRVAELLCRMQCNDFGVWDGLVVSVGAGVFPVGALVNHRCEASSAVTYRLRRGHRPEQEFRCTRELRVGDEVTHSYTDLASTRATRTCELRAQYFFDCTCPRCDATSAEVMALEKKLCGIKASVDGDGDDGGGDGEAMGKVEKAMRLHEEGQDKRRSAEEARELLGRAARMLEEVVWDAELDLRLMSVNAHRMTACIESRDWAGAAECGRRVLVVYRAVYPAVHPMLGLHLFTLGDLFSAIASGGGDGGGSVATPTTMKAMMSALEAHEEAHRILSITHGAEHKLVAVSLEGIIRRERAQLAAMRRGRGGGGEE